MTDHSERTRPGLIWFLERLCKPNHHILFTSAEFRDSSDAQGRKFVDILLQHIYFRSRSSLPGLAETFMICDVIIDKARLFLLFS